MDNLRCSRARVARRLRTKILFKSNKRVLNQTLFHWFSITWNKIRKSFEMSTKFNTKTVCTFLFFSPSVCCYKEHYNVECKTIISIITYLAWNLCFLEDTFGSLIVRLFRQFCVQEFSADTQLYELVLQRGKLGRLKCFMYWAEF